jgi:hypothetical protein
MTSLFERFANACRMQRADARMRVLMAPVQKAALFEVLLCLPTAPALPVEGNGDFGRSPIYGQLPDKPLLVYLPNMECRT